MNPKDQAAFWGDDAAAANDDAPLTALDHALASYRRGFRVFPTRPTDAKKARPKQPKGWAVAADEQMIRGYWAQRPDSNYGIIAKKFGTGKQKLLLLDVDNKPKLGKDGLGTLQRLEQEHGPLPATYTQGSPSGGKHFIFLAPRRMRVTTNRAGPGIDTPWMVVGAGSRRPGGGEYTVLVDAPVAEAPQWLLDLVGFDDDRATLDIPVPGTTKDDDRCDGRKFLASPRAEVSPTASGTNSAAYKTACQLRVDFDYAEQDALDDMLEFYLPRCAFGVEADLDHCIREPIHNAFHYARGKLSGVNAKKEFTVWVNPNPPGAEPAEDTTEAEQTAGKPDDKASTSESAEGTSAGAKALPFECFDDIKPDLKRPWLVKHWLGAGGSSLFYGPKGSNKTFLLAHTALCIAMGWDWFGHKVQQGPVLYCALEGGHGFKFRIEAMKLAHGLAGKHVPIYVVTKPLNLSRATRQTTDEIIATMREIEKREGQMPVFGIVDTVHRALHGADENDSAAVGAFIANLDYVRHATGAHMTGIHHTGKNKANGPRGSSAFGGDVDTMIYVDQGKASIPEGDMGKQRDGAAGGAIGFRRVDVDLGLDADGEMVRSCVIEEAPLLSGTSSQVSDDSHAGRLLRLAVRAQAEHGVVAPERLGLFPGEKVLPLEKLASIFIDEYEALKAAGLSSVSDDDRRGIRQAGSNAFRRAVIMLEQAKKIEKDNQFLWIA